MKLVRNSFKYWEFIRQLRNNEEIKEGFECGIGVDQFSKFKEGDVIVCFEIQSIKRKLELK